MNFEIKKKKYSRELEHEVGEATEWVGGVFWVALVLVVSTKRDEWERKGRQFRSAWPISAEPRQI